MRASTVHVARSAVLLVRSAHDLASAIAGANDFLRFRRRGLPPTRDELLGVWLRRELDADLHARHSPNGAVRVHESFALSGVWSMCWLDLSAAESTRERRCRVVDALVRPESVDSTSTNLGVFFAVFDAAQEANALDETLAELRVRFPALIAATWFVDETVSGLSGPWRAR